jgi:hypothetical protein
MRPGRRVITSTRSPRNTASSTLWVMKNTVLRVAAQSRASSSCKVSRVIASTAAKGSSIRITSGSAAQVRATATRWRMPPDSSCG